MMFVFVSVVSTSESLPCIALLADDRVEVVVGWVLFFFVLDGLVDFVTVLIIEWYIVWDLFVLKL